MFISCSRTDRKLLLGGVENDVYSWRYLMREYWIKILLRSVKIIDENTFIAEVSSEPRLEEDGYMHAQVVEDNPDGDDDE